MNDSHTHKPRPLIDLAVSILLPSLILMKLSSPEHLGPSMALVAALAFPLGWGLFELLRYRKFNFIALLGLVSVMLTGGIGLLELDTRWLAVKEAAVPGVIGLVVLGSTLTRKPLIHVLLFNENVLDVPRIRSCLEQNGKSAEFERHLLIATWWLGGTFFFSSLMNYILARWLVTSPAGSAAFNAELAQMNLYSYPMIAIPSMLMMIGIFWYLWRTIHGMTGLGLEEIMAQQHRDKG